MTSILWLLLSIGAHSVAAEGTSNISVEQFDLGDAIYEKQKECDAIVGDAVVTALDKGDDYEIPVPKDDYFQCKRALDEKKKEYITTYLGGLELHPKSFSIELSNKPSLTLASPAASPENSDSTGFDLQQELCVTNNLCLAISDLKVSTEEDVNEKKKSVDRCLGFLDKLKFSYMDELKISKQVLQKKIGGLPATCTYGEIVFLMPKDKTEHNDIISEHSGESKTESDAVLSDGENKLPVSESEYSTTKVNAGLINYNGKVLGNEVKPFAQEKEDVEQLEEKNELVTGEGGHVKSSVNQLYQDTCGNNCETDSSSKKSHGASPHQDEKAESKLSETVNIPDVTKDTKIDTSDLTPKVKETPVPRGRNEEIVQKPKRSTNRRKNKRTRQYDENENMETVSYRVKVIKKNGEGKVVKIQANGQIKKTESEDQSASLQEESPPAKSELEADNDLEHQLGFAPEKGFDLEKKQHQESLEENIVHMENDCKELLEFGERLLKYKMLSSLEELETHYNDCILKLDDLKKLYIEEHQLDVKPHKNIFPLTLPSGVQKLLSLPAQLLNTDLTKTDASSSNMDDAASKFDLNQLFLNKEKLKNDIKTREPFDDPAFIPNFEFLESLQRETPITESSRLSKVASILHISQGHNTKEVLQ